MPVPDVVGDTEPHIFNFWNSEYVINPLLFEPTFNRTKSYLFASGCIPFVEIYKYTSFTSLNLYRERFVVHMVVGGAVPQVDTCGV